MKYLQRSMKNKGNLFIRIASLALCTVSCSLLTPNTASAYSGGISFKTVEGCSCHVNQSDATALSLTSATGELKVEPGKTLTLTLAVAHASKKAAGVNITITDAHGTRAGTLSATAGEKLKVASGELVHSSPKQFVDGKVSYTFTWTAPAMAGTYTLRAAANAVDGSGNTSGDEYNLFSQAIVVGPVTDVRDEVAPANLQTIEIFPNPVQAQTTTVGVRYTLAQGHDVTVELYDAHGRVVVATVPEYKEAGEHAVELDTRTMANGMYIAVVRAGGERLVRHITIAK